MRERQFEMRHVVTNFSKMTEEHSETEKHYGVPWKLILKHEENHLVMFLHCEQKDEEGWEIGVDFECRIVSTTGKKQLAIESDHDFAEEEYEKCVKFDNWDDIVANHVVDDTLIVECDVTIKLMEGIAREQTVNFDCPDENRSDGILIFGDRRFHVLKATLALQSQYFHALFFGNFCESTQSEIHLKDQGVNADDFHLFLEVIYGKSSIYAENVDDMLYLADKYSVKMVKNQCEEISISTSTITDKQKLEMADLYDLKRLKKHCLKNATSMEAVRDLLPADIDEFGDSTLAALFRKSITLPSDNNTLNSSFTV